MTMPRPLLVLVCAGCFHIKATELKTVSPADLEVADGFAVELIYTVPKESQGSWVALAADPNGQITAADQYGKLYRVTPPPIGTKGTASIRAINAKLPALRGGIAESDFGAHGLIHAFDSLYVMVNEVRGKEGIWRLKDTTGDGEYDQSQYLVPIDGRGEHGPHSFAVTPDGKRLIFNAGNFSRLPSKIKRSRPVKWDEDHLLPRMWDARGHASGWYAPGGYISSMSPDGSDVELIAIGFRNHFDFAYDQNGELFTFDSDMEWDLGTPWYMPTRINHVIPGGDYGWRSGAGRWPDYYLDSLPSTIDIGPGSPTGTTFGTGARFPARYQHALFAADWTYGTLYAVHHTADGASYRGEAEEFLTGRPLPLTDIVVSTGDGALYFAIGGRKIQSALYRIVYVGNEDTTPVPPPEPSSGVQLRRELAELHKPKIGKKKLERLWQHLGSSDRFIRYTARVALEHQAPSKWSSKALSEEDPATAIEALTAMARVAPPEQQSRLVSSLKRFRLDEIDPTLQLSLLRAWQLAFTRMGPPNEETKAEVLEHLEPHFPIGSDYADRELSALLIYLGSKTVVKKSVHLLEKNSKSVEMATHLGSEALVARNARYGGVFQKTKQSSGDLQQFALAYNLRNAVSGWTPELREAYFRWFAKTYQWKGGASFGGFIENIRKEALQKVENPQFRDVLDKLSAKPIHSIVDGAVAPQGPGRVYTVDEATALVSERLHDRDLIRGKAMFTTTACISCHSFDGEGGGIGPDLTKSGNRYTVRELLEAIIEPSKAISDQYGAEIFETANGKTLVGKLANQGDDYLVVNVNPFDPTDVRYISLKGTKRSASPQSLMPPGLINALNPDELADLVAFLLSDSKE